MAVPYPGSKNGPLPGSHSRRAALASRKATIAARKTRKLLAATMTGGEAVLTRGDIAAVRAEVLAVCWQGLQGTVADSIVEQQRKQREMLLRLTKEGPGEWR